MDVVEKAKGLMEQNKSEEAVLLIESNLKLLSDEEKYTAAEFLWNWGFLEKAEQILIKLMHTYPEDSELKIMLGEIYIELEQDEQAIQLLSEITPKEPAYIQALIQLADLYQAQGLFEVSESKLLEAKEMAPEEPIIDLALGELYFSIGKFKQSTVYYEKLYKNHTKIANISISNRLAEAYSMTGNYEAALSYYEQVKTDESDTLFKHGLTAYYADRKEMAINLWERLIHLDPYYYKVYHELAKAYKDEGKLKEAYNVCMKGIEIDNFNKELYYLASMVAYEEELYEESEELIHKAISLDPEYLEAVLFLIRLLKKREDYEEIVQVIKNLKAFGSVEDPIFELELARAYYKLEHFSSALHCYEEAYIELKDDSEFLKEYSYFLVEEGKREEAISVLNLYLEHEPFDEEVREFMERLIYK